jgi:hypothetical protein
MKALTKGRALAQRLTEILDEAGPKLANVTEAEASRAHAPGKWSSKQIIGHLIDSAINNHARFVRAQLQDDLVFPGYDQDAWVRVQRYDLRAWPELVSDWRIYNRRIAALMGATPDAELDRPRKRHNLHEIGFQPLPSGADATLGFLMSDYIVHLHHHVRQVLKA